MASFDKREEFEKNCRSHLEEIRSWCILYGIPFYFSACVKNDDKGSVYINEAALTSTTGVKLTNDQLKKHLLVGLDFDVVPRRTDMEIQTEDPDSM